MGHGEAISPEGTADSVSQISFSLAYAMLLSKAKLLHSLPKAHLPVILRVAFKVL